MIKILLITLTFIFSLTACGTAQPLYNASSSLSKPAQSVSEMRMTIIEALNFKRWQVIEETDNVIRAGINVRSHYAEIEINYTDSNFSIVYVKSENLDYSPRKTKIHRNYNKWIILLEDEIKQRQQIKNYQR